MGKKKNRQKKKTPKFEWRPKKTPPPPWIELPTDVTANILNRLGAIEILEKAQFVCKTWHRVCTDPLMWRKIDIKNSYYLHDYDSLCRRAVDLSQGDLIDFSIQNFGDDSLLNYISQRCTRLKRVRLVSCDDISGQGVSEAVKKFPELNELHLFYITPTSGPVIESIGSSCPLLNSFTFNVRGYRQPFVDYNDEHALAVAKTMPSLHHLSLMGNRMTISGLEAIHAGCPNLESLDIRQCFSVDLTRDQERYARQICDLKGPFDSVADYEFDATIYDDEDDELYTYSDGYDWCLSEGDYDDFTNPFSREYMSDSDAFLFDELSISGYNTGYLEDYMDYM